MTRKTLMMLLLAGCVSAPAAAAAAAQFPVKPVRMIVPFGAGSNSDVLARTVAVRMAEHWGQQVVVDNRPGAGGNIGIAAVTGSTPDGYTIGAATVGHFAINQFLYLSMPYDPEKDMIPATLTWELPNVFVVASDHCPATTLTEFIAWAKAKGHINFGSPGVGTSPHLSGVMFVNRTGLDSVHVPFRGAAQTIPAMLSGDVTFAIDNLASYIPQIQSGKMRALAVTSAQRWPTMLDVPTMVEAGMKDFVVTSWAAFVVPTGTPRAMIDRLSGAMELIAGDPDIQRRFLVAGARCIYSTPEQAIAFAAKERAMWKEVVLISGIQPN